MLDHSLGKSLYFHFDMHNELKLSLLYVRTNHHMASACHRNINFEGQPSLDHFYVPILHNNLVQTRAEHDKCMVIPTVRTNAGAKSFSVRGPKFWNPIMHE